MATPNVDVVGAILGTVFGELLRAVLQVKDEVRDFRPQMIKLEGTLRQLEPVIRDIGELNEKLNRPDQSETEPLMTLMKEGTDQVSKCLTVGRLDIFKKLRYRRELVKLDSKILRQLIYMPAYTLREAKRATLEAKELSDRLQCRSSFTTSCSGYNCNGCYIPSSFSASNLVRCRSPDVSLETAFKYEADFAVGPAARATNRHGAPIATRPTSIRALLICIAIVISGAGQLKICAVIAIVIYIVIVIAIYSHRAIRYVVERLEQLDHVVMLKMTTEQLKATLDSLLPVLLEIKSDQSEIENLRKLMEEGRMLVRVSSNIGWWNFLKNWWYQEKLVEMENKLLRFHSHYLQARTQRDQATTSDGSEMHDKEFNKHAYYGERIGQFVDQRVAKPSDPWKMDLREIKAYNSFMQDNFDPYPYLEHNSLITSPGMFQDALGR